VAEYINLEFGINIFKRTSTLIMDPLLPCSCDACFRKEIRNIYYVLPGKAWCEVIVDIGGDSFCDTEDFEFNESIHRSTVPHSATSGSGVSEAALKEYSTGKLSNTLSPSIQDRWSRDSYSVASVSGDAEFPGMKPVVCTGLSGVVGTAVVFAAWFNSDVGILIAIEYSIANDSLIVTCSGWCCERNGSSATCWPDRTY
jgi:hypothetical protein